MSPRAAEAELRLRALGVAGRVRECGHDGDIAAISVPADRWADLLGEPGREVARELRSLGFRYVTLDLAP